MAEKIWRPTPLDRWFARWMQQDAAVFLTGPRAMLPHCVVRERLRSYLHRVSRGGFARERQIMALFVLESWLRGAMRAT